MIKPLFGTRLERSPDGDVPWVSVIIPSHNSKQSLLRVLDSLMRQEYPEHRYEIIVVDDGSTDGTYESIKNYRVSCIRNEHSVGLNASLNRGLESAKGEILVFLHSNHIPCDPDWLQILVSNFADESVGVVSSYFFIDLDDAPQAARYFSYVYIGGWKRKGKNFGPKEERVIHLVTSKHEVPISATNAHAYRKSLLDVIGNFDERFGALIGRVLGRSGGDEYDTGMIVAKTGYKVVLDTRARVIHDVSNESSILFHLKKSLRYSAAEYPFLLKHKRMINPFSVASTYLILLGLLCLLGYQLLPTPWNVISTYFLAAVIFGVAFSERYRLLLSHSAIISYLLSLLLIGIAYLIFNEWSQVALSFISVLGFMLLVPKSMLQGYAYFRELGGFIDSIMVVVLHHVYYFLYGLGSLYHPIKAWISRIK